MQALKHTLFSSPCPAVPKSAPLDLTTKKSADEYLGSIFQEAAKDLV